MERIQTRLAIVFILGAVLVVAGVIVLVNSTHFNPNPFMENDSNPTGQLSGVVVAATGILVISISAAAGAVCSSIAAQREDS